MEHTYVEIGTKVFCKHKIKILEYFSESDTFVVVILTDSGPEYVHIPIQISTLGIRFHQNDFCRPGDHNPYGHPDYYERKYIAPTSRRAVYDYAGDKVYIVADSNFHYNGKYYLEYLDTGEQIEKQAQLRTEEEKGNLLNELIGLELSGDVLTGVVVRMFVRVRDLPGDDSDEGIDIIYFQNTVDDDAELYHADDIRIVIHDEGTHAEYELPLALIKTY